MILKKNFNEDSNFNNANINIVMTDDEQLCFIKTLMFCMNRQFVIINNNLLIDLSRNDFEIVVDETTKNVSIMDYKQKNNNIIYINEKLFKKKFFPDIYHGFEYYNNVTNTLSINNLPFIMYHCKRIVANTFLIDTFVKNLISNKKPK